MSRFEAVLIKRVHGIKCCRLDAHGNRCRKDALLQADVFENPEHDGRWVLTFLCDDHATVEERKEAFAHRGEVAHA